MPRQYVVCGRMVPRFGARRISMLLVTLALLAVFSLLLTLPGGSAASPKRFAIPKSFKSPWMNKINPFKQPSHAPHRQKNDTDGDSWWYSDWNWLRMPFSSSVTLDENRALLPMLKERTPIYCYYANTVDKDRSSRDAESDLLLAWRRAWWAQGLKPIILSPAEAMNNPLYEEVQKLPDLTPELKTELMRWLAWENMGDGLLAHHLLFPMGPHDDPLLTFLRRGEFPTLTRFKGLDDGLFVGSKGQVAAAIKAAMASPKDKKAETMVAAVESDKKENPFAVDDTPKSLAYYSARQIEALYAKVGKAITESHAAGLRSLTQLISAHLHLTWQNIFTGGIAVVKPLPQHTTHLITPAYELAQRLAHCPENPLPDTCPPNRPDCRPCDDSKPMKITTPSSYSSSRTLYTIGTVPHPYTSLTLNHLKTQLNIPWIRRSSPRDAWLTSLTSSLFDAAISTTPRLLRFKEAVASDDDDTTPGGSGGGATTFSKSSKSTSTAKTAPTAKGGACRSLWLPAESPFPTDLDWHFGFALPSVATYTTTASSPGKEKGGNAPPPMHSAKDGPPPTPEEQALEPALLRAAQAVVQTTPTLGKGRLGPQKKKEELVLRDAVEAWNLADTEAWRFARAYLARKTVERKKWEEEESRFAGGVGSEKAKSSITTSSAGEQEKTKDKGDGEEGKEKEKEKEKGKGKAGGEGKTKGDDGKDVGDEKPDDNDKGRGGGGRRTLRGAWDRWMDRD
ncbi:hypothetical protein NEMBOFW57_010202 [Staphylotrichum longicolle]|uniref:Uncharacterized protein n=1 Tax=Staphylotrichum longicolle TaxID=669026 RepID=A0AAD4HYF0_9PEZI|nr:hypothetical protein NEMBOFW57_010202 [Staphylotrichum longicolle]